MLHDINSNLKVKWKDHPKHIQWWKYRCGDFNHFMHSIHRATNNKWRDTKWKIDLTDNMDEVDLGIGGGHIQYEVGIKLDDKQMEYWNLYTAENREKFFWLFLTSFVDKWQQEVWMLCPYASLIIKKTLVSVCWFMIDYKKIIYVSPTIYLFVLQVLILGHTQLGVVGNIKVIRRKRDWSPVGTPSRGTPCSTEQVSFCWKRRNWTGRFKQRKHGTVEEHCQVIESSYRKANCKVCRQS